MASFIDPLAQAADYNNRGTEARTRGDWQEAIALFEQARELWPANSDILFNLANTHHDKGDLDRAIVFYRQALNWKPPYAAEVSNSLATALKEQGQLDDARRQYLETLQLQPDHAMATLNLSELAGAGKYEFAAEDVRRMKASVADREKSPAERALLGFALGNVLDRQGAYDEAFAHFRQANDLKRALLEERGLAFDADLHDAVVDRIIQSTGRSYFERVKKWGTNSELPIFIIGMPRSGSTLIEQILASHAQVFGGGEIGNIYRFITKGVPVRNLNLEPAHLVPNLRVARKVAADYVEFLENLAPRPSPLAPQRVSVKYLENYLHLGAIATLLPRAHIIHSKRDPLDVCLSCYFQNFQEMPFAFSLEDIGRYYRTYEKLMSHWSRVLPLPIYDVSYEDLVQNQEKVTRELLAFCGLEWDERCLKFFDTRRVVQTASSVQVRKPVSTQAVGRWKNYRSHLGPLMSALGRADVDE